MGLRFRKSIKVAPGVKVNFNKSSVSTTIGSRGAHYTVNSKGRKTVSVGVPGTGLSYTKTSTKSSQRNSGSAAKRSSSSNSSSPHRRRNRGKKWYQKTGWILFFLIIFFPIGLFLMWKYSNWNKIIKLILSFLFGITFMGIVLSPKLESITLTADTSTVYDIDDAVKIKIKTDPDDYKIQKNDFEISGGTIDIDGKKVIFTASKAGKYKIFVEKSGVTSNTITLKYEDKAALEKEREEERIAAEQAIQEKLAEKQAEQERLEAEQAEQERLEAERAEQEQLAVAQANQESNSSAQAAGQAGQSQPENEAMVYLSATGEKYHSIPNCGRMNPNKARQVSLSEAQAQGYEPCSKCY